MKIYFTLTKKGIAAILSMFILCVIVGGELSAASNGIKNGDTHRHRTEFIAHMGIKILDSQPLTAEIRIPQEFGEVYENYNALQNMAGYDLKKYKGCSVTRYTYPTENGEEQVNLLVYNGRIIGGDISSVRLDGSMKPLKGK